MDRPHLPAPVQERFTAPLRQFDSWLRVRRRLLRYALMVVRDADLAEDLVQESLVAMLEHPDAYHGEALRTTWATGILKHKIADWYREPYQHRRLRMHDAEDDHDESIPLARDADVGYDEQATLAWQEPEGQEMQREMLAVLEECLHHLTEQARAVFVMHELLGFETSEIRGRMGLTEENCRTILHRARVDLRHCLHAHGHVFCRAP